MCGRFVRSSPIVSLAEEFRVEKALVDIPPSYNICPSQDVVILSNKGIRQLVACRWGYIPSWAKAPSACGMMINARAETVASKPAFKTAFLKQRCLVMADGFYEWRKEDSKKTPVFVRLKSGRPFGFAGLYSLLPAVDGKTICSCVIITTDANDLLNPIHDRMPVIIPGEKQDLWLNPAEKNPGALLKLLKPYPSGEMEMYEVSLRINNPEYDSPAAINPISSE